MKKGWVKRLKDEILFSLLFRHGHSHHILREVSEREKRLYQFRNDSGAPDADSLR